MWANHAGQPPSQSRYYHISLIIMILFKTPYYYIKCTSGKQCARALGSKNRVKILSLEQTAHKKYCACDSQSTVTNETSFVGATRSK